MINYATTAVLVVSTILFLVNINRGVALTTTQLRDIHDFTVEHVEKFFVEARIYNGVAILTMAVGIVAMVVDYKLTNDRQQDGISSNRCSQSLQPILTVSVGQHYRQIFKSIVFIDARRNNWIFFWMAMGITQGH